MSGSEETKSGIVGPSGDPVQPEPSSEEKEKQTELEKKVEQVKEELGSVKADSLFVIEANVFEYIGSLDDPHVVEFQMDELGNKPFKLVKAFRLDRGQDRQTGQIVTIPFGPFTILISKMTSAREATAGERGAYGVWRMEAAGLVAANQMPAGGLPPGTRSGKGPRR
jgi:hypothetical protein